MSSQSLGRSNIALQTARCSGPRIGIVAPANGTLRIARHLFVNWGIGKEEIDRIVAPPQTALSVPLQRVLGDRRRLPRLSKRIDHLLPIAHGHEEVEVDVNRRTGLGVVGESQCSSYGVRHPRLDERFVNGQDLVRKGRLCSGWGNSGHWGARVKGQGSAAPSRLLPRGGRQRVAAGPTRRGPVAPVLPPPSGHGQSRPVAMRRWLAISRKQHVEQDLAQGGIEPLPLPAPKSVREQLGQWVARRPELPPGGRRVAIPPRLASTALTRAFSIRSSVSSRNETRVRLRGPSVGIFRLANLESALSGRNYKCHSGKIYHYGASRPKPSPARPSGWRRSCCRGPTCA